jgi:hypothetical protein
MRRPGSHAEILRKKYHHLAEIAVCGNAKMLKNSAASAQTGAAGTICFSLRVPLYCGQRKKGA